VYICVISSSRVRRSNPRPSGDVGGIVVMARARCCDPADTISCAPSHKERWSSKLPLQFEKQTAKGPSAKMKKTESSLQSLEVYEVAEELG